MANLEALNEQILEAAALTVVLPTGERIEEARISAITVTSNAGTENQTGPNRVLGHFNTAGGFALAVTVNPTARHPGPNWQQLSDDKTVFVVEVADIVVTDGTPSVVSTQQYNGTRAVVNTTYDAPKAYDITLTATGRDPVIQLLSAA